MPTRHLAIGMVVAFGVGVLALGDASMPARYRSGSIPALPALSVAVGGGQVIVEADVAASGVVRSVTPLRETESFTSQIVTDVTGWTFTPARGPVEPHPTMAAVASKVLVAAVFRPPSLIGPTIGAPIEDVAPASDDVPFPTSIVTPLFPPRAHDPGVVLVEVTIDARGAVTGAAVRQSAPAFDAPALDAAKKWTWRPAHAREGGSPAVAYIIFGFPTPIAG